MASLGALPAKRRGVEEQHQVGQDALEGGASAAPSAARLRACPAAVLRASARPGSRSCAAECAPLTRLGRYLL